MPIEQIIWKVGQRPERLTNSKLDSEQELEEMICSDISILNEQWMLIGRQVMAACNRNLIGKRVV